MGKPFQRDSIWIVLDPLRDPRSYSNRRLYAWIAYTSRTIGVIGGKPVQKRSDPAIVFTLSSKRKNPVHMSNMKNHELITEMRTIGGFMENNLFSPRPTNLVENPGEKLLDILNREIARRLGIL